LKAAAPAVTTGSGADVAGAPASAWYGFEQALRTSSVFDAVASEAMQSQFRLRVGMLTTQLSGAKVAEGAAKLGQVLQFGAGVLTPVKLVSLLAVTQEFLDGAPGAMESLMGALRVAVSSAADLGFTRSRRQIAIHRAAWARRHSPTYRPTFSNKLGMIDYCKPRAYGCRLAGSSARNGVACQAAALPRWRSRGTFAGLRVIVSDSHRRIRSSLIDASGLVVASAPIDQDDDSAFLELATTSSRPARFLSSATGESMFRLVGILAER
jgi:hypothetical protein